MPDTDPAEQRAALQRWLGRSHAGEAVTYVETHVSILAFGRERAWKLKKAVKYPFLDLSTSELRRQQCEREVALNRRLAPDVYLGVVDLDDDTGRVVDHLVEMRRMPDERRLAALVAGKGEAESCLGRVAEMIARFHAGAPSGGAIDANATREAVLTHWNENIAELYPHAGPVIELGELERGAQLGRRYLQGRAPLFDDRIAAGRARDGHGDLLADDIFCLADGPRVLDCLEFDDHLRWGDTLADVAFLAMDLERLDRADLARAFLDRYASVASDSWPRSLEDLYIAARALVRSKVACLRADGGVTEAAASARRLLTLANEHLEHGRVRLVLIGGPPATGKTTIADAVARQLGWPVLHSDEIRKELAGVSPTTHMPAEVDEGIYTREWNLRTYDALCRRARRYLEHGRSVVLDASWSEAPRRTDAIRVAGETSSDLLAFRCDAPLETTIARAHARASLGTDASDARGEVIERVAARFSVWPEARLIDTTTSAKTAVAHVVAATRQPAQWSGPTGGRELGDDVPDAGSPNA